MLITELEGLKGKTIEEAEKIPKYKDYRFRIIEENGVAKNITTETIKNRINVGINHGKIVEIVGMY